jgi:hypothetical protein
MLMRPKAAAMAMSTSGKRSQCVELPVPLGGQNLLKETKNMTPMAEILVVCLVAVSLSRGACGVTQSCLAGRRSDLKRGPQF